MELKQYQRDVLKEVGRFARTYAMTRDAATAYGIFMNAIGLTPGKDGIERYRDDLGGVPKVCVKVPTGGGKTFIGACAIDVLSDALPSHDEVVVWLVPRREILVQTLRNFRNPEHFLRMRLDRDFAGRVEVLDKEDGLRGRSFSAATVGDQLTLFVLSYDSFKNKDGRRAYAENSSLAGLTAYQQDVGTAVDVEGRRRYRAHLCSGRYEPDCHRGREPPCRVEALARYAAQPQSALCARAYSDAWQGCERYRAGDGASAQARRDG